MRKPVPPMPSKKLAKLLTKAGARFIRHGKGDHDMYERVVDGIRHAAPVQMGKRELRPEYSLRVFRQLKITDDEINHLV